MSYTAILEEINKLSIEERLSLLEAISHSLKEELAKTANPSGNLTADQIRKLPREERQKILTASARLAVSDYMPGGELTEFTRDLEGEDIYEYD